MKKGIHPENYRLVAFKESRDFEYIASVLYGKDETRGYGRSRGQILPEIQEEIILYTDYTEKKEPAASGCRFFLYTAFHSYMKDTSLSMPQATALSTE